MSSRSKSKASSPLENERHERFAVEYCKHLNASRAYREIGGKARNARQAAHELLTKPDVLQRIDVLMVEHGKKLVLSLNETLIGLGRVATFDVRKLVDDEGHLIPVEQLDTDTAMALAGIDVEESGGDEPIRVRKYRANDRMRALEILARYHNAFAAEEKTKADALSSNLAAAMLQAADAGRARVEAARARQRGEQPK